MNTARCDFGILLSLAGPRALLNYGYKCFASKVYLHTLPR